MDSVELLRWARYAAEALQSVAEPDAVLAAGYGLLGQEPPGDRNEALAIRIVRLLIAADERRTEVLNGLLGYRGLRPCDSSGCRRPERSEAGGADAEALRLARYVEEHAAEGWPMLPEGFAPFEIAGRKGMEWFHGDLLIEEERNGRRVRLPDGGRPELAPGGAIKEVALGGLPKMARGLIDYAVETPVVFDIETGYEPWAIWDICCAFADQYHRILGDRRNLAGRRVGVPEDFWIERLTYYPPERLIHPWIGS
jgi:hypothetical protein